LVPDSLQPFRNERNEVIRWYATGTDIDERVRAEERTRNENLALREQIDRESMFEEIVGSSETLRKVLHQVAKVPLPIPQFDPGRLRHRQGTDSSCYPQAIESRGSSFHWR